MSHGPLLRILDRASTAAAASDTCVWSALPAAAADTATSEHREGCTLGVDEDTHTRRAHELLEVLAPLRGVADCGYAHALLALEASQL